ncbi:MAG: CHAD domain-containing protein [Methanoregulaceae archaeon]|nr:CHAD domain-containing protein [Methanoregulaceae archaeon]
MRPKRAEPPQPAFCAYGMSYIRKAYAALKREAKGAQAGDDSEHIHRLRVASRRLRAALPIFSSCFPRKNYRRWSRAVKKITSSLGRARDLDVQIAFLEEYMKNKEAGEAGAPHEIHGQDMALSGLETLLAKLKAERAFIQPDIEAIAGYFSGKGVLSDLPEAIRTAVKDRKSGMNLTDKASRVTGKRCAALVAFEPCVRVPDAMKAHHAMRIAAKKYRYTMEIFDDASDGRYKKLIRSIRKLQEILGMMHDCDVWIVTLQGQGLGEVVPVPGSGTVEEDTGIIALLEDRRNQRRILYQEFVRLWDQFRRKHLSGEIQGS